MELNVATYLLQEELWVVTCSKDDIWCLMKSMELNTAHALLQKVYQGSWYMVYHEKH